MAVLAHRRTPQFGPDRRLAAEPGPLARAHIERVDLVETEADIALCRAANHEHPPVPQERLVLVSWLRRRLCRVSRPTVTVTHERRLQRHQIDLVHLLVVRRAGGAAHDVQSRLLVDQRERDALQSISLRLERTSPIARSLRGHMSLLGDSCRDCPSAGTRTSSGSCSSRR